MRRQTLATALIIIFAAVTLAPIGEVHAANICGPGYFHGGNSCWNGGYDGDVISGRPDHDAMRNVAQSGSQTQRKDEFIDHIEAQLDDGNQDETGGAFIINTMVGAGRSGNPSKDKTPSSAMVNEWKARINNPEITISIRHDDPNNYGNGKISFYDGGDNDDFFTSYNSDDRGLIIFKHNGTIVYVVEIPCANPVGGLPGLPEAPDGWRVDAETSASSGPAFPGSTISWQHEIEEESDDNDTDPLTISYHWSTASGGTVPTGGGIGASPDYEILTERETGIVIGEGDEFKKTLTFTIPPGTPAGTRFCQFVRSNKTAYNNGSPISSTPRCITVSVVPIGPGTKPHFQIIGGDINAAASFSPGCSTTGRITAYNNSTNGNGSSSQIAALAAGAITEFASAKQSSPLAILKRLTFANTGSSPPASTQYGGGLGSSSLYCSSKDPDFDPTKPLTHATAPVIDGATYLNIADQRIIRTTGDVYIRGNTTYIGSFTLSTIPLLKIITNGNIYIESDVTELNGIFMTTGNIYTCAVQDPTNASKLKAPDLGQVSGVCKAQPLTIKGALIAKQIKLLRSRGDINTPPAETINYNPTTWLHALSTGTNPTGSGGRYDAYTILPPVL